MRGCCSTCASMTVELSCDLPGSWCSGSGSVDGEGLVRPRSLVTLVMVLERFMLRSWRELGLQTRWCLFVCIRLHTYPRGKERKERGGNWCGLLKMCKGTNCGELGELHLLLYAILHKDTTWTIVTIDRGGCRAATSIAYWLIPVYPNPPPPSAPPSIFSRPSSSHPYPFRQLALPAYPLQPFFITSPYLLI